MKKWANIRDSFMRSLRCGTGQAAKKKYMYSDHLQFLVKTGKTAETVNNFDFDVRDADDCDSDVTDEAILQEDEDLTVNTSEPVSSVGISTSRKVIPSSKFSRKRQLDPLEREIIRELKEEKSPKLKSPPSDHEMITSSFLPHIRDLTASELLEFQIQTLALIQSIKRKRDIHTGYTFQPSPLTIHSSDGNKSSSRGPTPSPAQYIEIQSNGQHASSGGENNFENLLLLCSTNQDHTY